eukprot:PhF_6_TR15966/c0_g1_i2/m.24930
MPVVFVSAIQRADAGLAMFTTVTTTPLVEDSPRWSSADCVRFKPIDPSSLLPCWRRSFHKTLDELLGFRRCQGETKPKTRILLFTLCSVWGVRCCIAYVVGILFVCYLAPRVFNALQRSQ